MDINIDLHDFTYALAETLSGSIYSEDGVYSWGWLYLYKLLTDRPFDVDSLYELVMDLKSKMGIDVLAYRDRMSIGFVLLNYVLEMSGKSVPGFQEFLEKIERYKFHGYSPELIGVLYLVAPDLVSEYIDPDDIINEVIQASPKPLYMLVGKAIKGEISEDLIARFKSNRVIFDRLYKRKNLEYLALYLAIVSKDVEEARIAYHALREVLSSKIYNIITSLREYVRVMSLVSQGAVYELSKEEHSLFMVVKDQVIVKPLIIKTLLSLRADMLAKTLIAIHLSKYDDIIVLPHSMKKYVELAEKFKKEKATVIKKKWLLLLLNAAYVIPSYMISSALLPFIKNQLAAGIIAMFIQVVENILIPHSREMIWEYLREKF